MLEYTAQYNWFLHANYILFHSTHYCVFNHCRQLFNIHTFMYIYNTEYSVNDYHLVPHTFYKFPRHWDNTLESILYSHQLTDAVKTTAVIKFIKQDSWWN